MSRFPTERHAASWAGLCPGNHQSAGKRLSGKTRKGNAALRAALTEHRRARGQRAQLRRLRRGAPAPVTTLPFLFEAEIGPPELERLARRLGS
jgi:transposase